MTHEDSEDVEILLEAHMEKANSIRGYYGSNYNRPNSPQFREFSNDVHIAQTSYSKQVCFVFEYSNHYVGDCSQGKPVNRNLQLPYQTVPKNE